jgi:hypothetical protein
MSKDTKFKNRTIRELADPYRCVPVATFSTNIGSGLLAENEGLGLGATSDRSGRSAQQSYCGVT